MGRLALPHPPKGLLEDLESTRADLLAIQSMVLRKLGDAQSAQWLAATAGVGIAPALGFGNRAVPASPAELAAAVRQYEEELSHVRKVIANVDSRLARVAR